MMLIPGTVDGSPHSLYEGLSYGDMPLYMSANDITDYWSNYNNTDINPVVTDVINSTPNDGSTVERKLWLNGDNCVSIQELKVINGDHEWPGTFGNMDINATEEIWNFVSQFNLEGQIDCDQLSTDEIKSSTAKKELVQVIDVLGRKVVNHHNKNQILFYIFDDGSVEKIKR